MGKQYTINEAAAYLGVSPQAVHRAVKKGKLPATTGKITKVVDVILISDRDLEAYHVDLNRQRAGKKTG